MTMVSDENKTFKIMIGTVFLFCGLIVLLLLKLQTSFFAGDRIYLLYFGVCLYSLLLFVFIFMARFYYFNALTPFHLFHSSPNKSRTFNDNRIFHLEDNRRYSSSRTDHHENTSNDRIFLHLEDSVVNRPTFGKKRE